MLRSSFKCWVPKIDYEVTKTTNKKNWKSRILKICTSSPIKRHRKTWLETRARTRTNCRRKRSQNKAETTIDLKTFSEIKLVII
jgi:hypothetical protein